MKTSFVMKFCERVHSELHLRLNEKKLGKCAKMKMPIENIDRHKQVVNILDSGDFPEECFMCENAEQQGIRSWRDQGNEVHTKNKIFKIEITLDNTCNLACGYCYGNLSSVWEAEAKNAPDEYKHLSSLEAEPNNATLQQSLDYIYRALRQAAERAKDVDRVELILLGGEPFFNDLFKNNHLTPLVDEYFKLTTDHKTSFLLNVFTNCNTPKNMIDKYVQEINSLKEKYKHTNLYFQLSVSNESIGQTSEAIRYGSDWNNFKSNLNKFFQSSVDRIQFHLTVNSLGITKLKNYLEYIHQMKLDFPNKSVGVQLSQIYEPMAFSISVLDESFVKYLIEAQEFSNSIKLTFDGLSFEELIASVGKNQDKKYLLKEYVDYYKKVRKVDLALIEPDVYNYVVE